MSELTTTPIPKEPTINFAIGPNCPVRCEGCYNHFGETALNGGLITADEVIDFASAAQDEGVTQATLSGGDPLFHPEIVPMAKGLKELGLKVKLDTVGTAFLGDTAIMFKGRGTAARVKVADIAPHVGYVNVPLDGAKQSTLANFRRGRPKLFDETRAVAGLLRAAGVPFGLNTVANTTNLAELPAIRDIAEEVGASEWQVFEYDPNGPNPTKQKDRLRLAPGQFDEATSGLVSTSGKLKVVVKSLAARSSVYFLVDDSGRAWKPSGEGLRHVFGHITQERDLVMAALGRHIAELQHPVV